MRGIAASDWQDYIGVILFLGVIAFNILRRIFKPKNEKLDEFLKSLDVEEDEEEVEIPFTPRKVAPPPLLPLPSSPAIHRRPTTNPLYYQVELPKKKKERRPALFSDSKTFRHAIVVQTVLNKPKGAWW